MTELRTYATRNTSIWPWIFLSFPLRSLTLNVEPHTPSHPVFGPASYEDGVTLSGTKKNWKLEDGKNSKKDRRPLSTGNTAVRTPTSDHLPEPIQTTVAIIQRPPMPKMTPGATHQTCRNCREATKTGPSGSWPVYPTCAGENPPILVNPRFFSGYAAETRRTTKIGLHTNI